ncbi:unnamed protein product [Arabidopsis thaliana]|uniref:(thale cress) hypothetical protein n=1 Tax=Arabidopsis thaliana TaxID=3702 RepID=A0A7G2ER86_ARATH|nr:unnamed protein product [Arabidopsis thaliana]
MGILYMEKWIHKYKNLEIRGIVADTSCKRCGGEEDVAHLFFRCPFAKQVWDSVPGSSFQHLVVDAPLKTLLVGVHKILTLPPIGLGVTPLFPWILWFTWKARNLLVFENRLISAGETVLKAIKEVKAWQEASFLRKSPQICSSVAETVEPHQDAVRCFSDAAWKKESLRCGLGWIITDPRSNSVLQGSTSRPFVFSVLIAEALALKAVMCAALALGATRLACFSDCQELVFLLNSDGHANELDGILTDISRMVSSVFSVSFHFIPRVENFVADSLAKSALLSCNSSSFNGV